MKRRRIRCVHARAVAIYLALAIEVSDDEQDLADHFAWPVVSLTWLLAGFLAAQAWLTGLAWQMDTAVAAFDDWAGRVQLVATVAGIGWRATWWGLGLSG